VVVPGPMVVSLGTSGTLFCKAEAPVHDSSGAVCPFCDATGGGLPLLCTLNCTLPLQEVSCGGVVMRLVLCCHHIVCIAQHMASSSSSSFLHFQHRPASVGTRPSTTHAALEHTPITITRAGLAENPCVVLYQCHDAPRGVNT
jgi:hypothetical protein